MILSICFQAHGLSKSKYFYSNKFLPAEACWLIRGGASWFTDPASPTLYKLPSHVKYKFSLLHLALID